MKKCWGCFSFDLGCSSGGGSGIAGDRWDGGAWVGSGACERRRRHLFFVPMPVRSHRCVHHHLIDLVDHSCAQNKQCVAILTAYIHVCGISAPYLQSLRLRPAERRVLAETEPLPERGKRSGKSQIFPIGPRAIYALKWRPRLLRKLELQLSPRLWMGPDCTFGSGN